MNEADILPRIKVSLPALIEQKLVGGHISLDILKSKLKQLFTTCNDEDFNVKVRSISHNILSHSHKALVGRII